MENRIEEIKDISQSFESLKSLNIKESAIVNSSNITGRRREYSKQQRIIIILYMLTVAVLSVAALAFFIKKIIDCYQNKTNNVN